MTENRFYKNTRINILKIFNVLKKSTSAGETFLTVSEIARRTKLHKWTVSRTLDIYMSNFVEVVQPEPLETIGLQAKLVKLKDKNLNQEQVLRYLNVMRKI